MQTLSYFIERDHLINVPHSLVAQDDNKYSSFMKTIELNKKGNFDRWDQEILSELKNVKCSDGCGYYLIYQNETTKFSVFMLEPYERTPFKVFSNNFALMSLTGGTFISRFSNGAISLSIFEKGEYVKYNVNNALRINDFQNIDQSLLIMAIVESIQVSHQERCPHMVLNKSGLPER